MSRLKPRLAAYLVLLALPLGAATWVFGNFAAASEQRRSDTRLRSAIERGIDRFESALERAELEARGLAESRNVQRAFAQSDRRALRRLTLERPTVAFSTPEFGLVGRLPRPAEERSVRVKIAGRHVGRVIVAVPLDALVSRLARGTQLKRGSHILVVRGGRVVVPRDVRRRIDVAPDDFTTLRVGGVKYRALAARLLRGPPETHLAVLEPAAAIDAAAASVRRRVFGAGLAVILAIGVIAYAVAPGLSRGRFLQNQRAQAARVLAHLGEGVFLVDRDGIVRLWNRAAERVTGLAAESVQGRAAEEAIPGWAQLRARVPVAEPGRENEARAETLPFTAGARELWLSISGVDFAEGTVFAFRDLTDEHRLEQARRDFVATVSHELRTPVTSVYGAAMTLRARWAALSEATREQLLSVVADEATQLAHVVEQILLADQLDSGRVRTKTGAFDPVALASSVVDVARPRVAASGSIELVAPPFLPPVEADSERVRQVLSNLVENAVKYSPDGGRISVELERRDGNVRFTVRDEGLGIPAEEQQRIFEKFYRLDPNMTRGVGGSGLGLYICRGLVQQMNGSISVASEPGRGSAFSVELPLATTGRDAAER